MVITPVEDVLRAQGVKVASYISICCSRVRGLDDEKLNQEEIGQHVSGGSRAGGRIYTDCKSIAPGCSIKGSLAQTRSSHVSEPHSVTVGNP